jgi:hypothetical protein
VARSIGSIVFPNPKATIDVALTAHTEALLQEIQQHPIELVPQHVTTPQLHDGRLLWNYYVSACPIDGTLTQHIAAAY